MSPFALSGLLILITSFSLGIFVLIKTPHIFPNRLWAYFNFAIALWGLGAYEIGTAHDPASGLLWGKIAHVGVISIPVFFLHFSHYFLERKNKKLIICIYLTWGLLFIALVSGHLITQVKWMFNSFYYATNPTPIYIIFFFLWMSSVAYNYQFAYKKILTSTGEKRDKIKIFFISSTIGYIGGVTNFFPIFGINLYPYGNFLVAVFPLVMTFVILKYNLMDIHIVIRRSLIYSLLISSITIIFLLSVFVSERLFHQVIHYQNITTSIIMLILISFIFIPLKNKIQDFVDRAFFKATPLEMAQQNEKLKAIATLASGLAHEIKNPLTTLKIFAEYVPQKKDDPEFMKQFQRLIPQEIDRIDNLVHELLFFSKPSPPQKQTINPNEIINNIILMLKQKFDLFRINVDLNQQSKISLQADPNQFKQALLNIILNAIEAMPDGGTVTIISFVDNSNNCIIEISDTGNGINPKDLPHIFEPFFSKKDKGTGLGLAITQGIIEKHGGTINVKSKINEGTTFKIILKVG